MVRVINVKKGTEATRPKTQAEIDQDQADSAARKIPRPVSKVQFARALRQSGQWAAVKAAAQNLDPDLIEDWQLVNRIKVDDPVIEALRVEMGLTVEQVDNFFRSAAEQPG